MYVSSINVVMCELIDTPTQKIWNILFRLDDPYIGG